MLHYDHDTVFSVRTLLSINTYHELIFKLWMMKCCPGGVEDDSQQPKAESYIPHSTTAPKATITLHRRTDHGSILPSFAPIEMMQQTYNLSGCNVQYEHQYYNIEHKRWYLCRMRIQIDPVTLVNTPFWIPHTANSWISDPNSLFPQQLRTALQRNLQAVNC